MAGSRDTARVGTEHGGPAQVRGGEHTVARNRAGEAPLARDLDLEDLARQQELLQRAIDIGANPSAAKTEVAKHSIEVVEQYVVYAESLVGNPRIQAPGAMFLSKLRALAPVPRLPVAAASPAAKTVDPFAELEAEAERHRRTRDLVGPGADGAAAREGLMHALAALMNVLPASERRDVTCAELAALEAELQAELATPAHQN